MGEKLLRGADCGEKQSDEGGAGLHRPSYSGIAGSCCRAHQQAIASLPGCDRNPAGVRNPSGGRAPGLALSFDAMKSFAIALLGLFLVNTSVVRPRAQAEIESSEESAPRVLYVTSLPGTYHDYVVQRDIFREIAEKAGWDVTVITGSYRTLRPDGTEVASKGKKVPKGDTPESRARYERIMAEIAAQPLLMDALGEKDYAKGFDAIVYNFCLAHVTDLEVTRNIMLQTRAHGVPAFLIHCTMHSFWSTFKYKNQKQRLQGEWIAKHPDTPFPVWGDFTGIASTGHGPNVPIRTTRLVDHPVTAGVASGYTTPPTELYNNAYVVPGTVELLKGEQTIRRERKDGTVKTREASSTIMWMTPQGRSKVIGLTIGHGDADLRSDGFQSLLIDSVNWMIANPRGAAERPSWVWLGEPGDDQTVVFRKSFEVVEGDEKATLRGTCDNALVVFLNGERVLDHEAWWEVATRDVSDALRIGANELRVEARNDGGPAALAVRLDIDDVPVLSTDATWKAATVEDARAGKWSPVDVLGPVGHPDLVWSGQLTASAFGADEVVVEHLPAEPQAPEPEDGLHLPNGFRAELVYSVPKKSQGSWVSLTKDDRGRLYASDQGRQGIYRITPAKLGDPASVTTVQRVDVKVSGAQGLCWAHGSLYANVSGKGVWRITDTDGDDRLDRAENIVPLRGGGEHGPHTVIETEDGKGIYFSGGNHTDPPEFESSRAPDNWGEDLLLPRQWDARGHARGKLAPGGWIARCDPDGKHIEIVSSGYRNQYDLALDRHGEMFTYDADMEWDLGTPWYRPTRVCHAVSGSEFGWRSGTGKWPSYYEDSLPPVIDIGPGSPTGVVFGTDAAFPARYREALFILDWTFGTIYAIHLEPAGASFRATKEQFLWKKPLPVTDVIIGGDGAMYFTVGGRGAKSALYRVVYEGGDSAESPSRRVTDAAQQRRALERFHGRVDARAVDAAWPHLSSDDRFLRFAARIAIESQPVGTWRARALRETDPRAAPLALMALVRQGASTDLGELMAALERIELADATRSQTLAVLRTCALAFARLGAPDDAMRGRLIERFDALYPASSDAVNTELARLLTYLQSPTVVSKTLALMKRTKPGALPEWAELIQRNSRYGGPIQKMLADIPPLQNLAYAFILRNATNGWTMPEREDYFRFFVAAAAHPGGNSYAGFLKNIRREAEEKLSVTAKHRLAPILGQPLLASIPADITPPEGPGRAWTLEAAVETVGPKLRGRDFERGLELFHATACSACHRVDGAGGAIGPDLTTLANKFSVREVLESIVDPSAVISDQYGSKVVTATGDRVAVGLVVEGDAEVKVYQADSSTPPAVFARGDVQSIEDSPISQMPSGLINALNPEELRDLVAYLMSGGDKRAKEFKD